MVAQLAAILNKVVPLTVRINLLKHHRFLAKHAGHQIQEWAPIVIHVVMRTAA
jgi:hypothetical protein